MNRQVILTVDSLSGFTPTPVPDPLTASVDDGGSSSNTLPSIYQGYTISATLSFAVKYTEGETEYGTIPSTDVSSSFNYSSYGLTGTKISGSTFKISGTVSNVVAGESYIFLLEDLSLVTASPDSNIDFLAVIQYIIPASAEPVELTYPFLITAPDDITMPGPSSPIAFNLKQWVAWNATSSINGFRTLLSKGTI